MDFRLSTSKRFYDEKQKSALEKLGFTFKRTDEPYWKDRPFGKNNDQVGIKINSLEDLIEFSRKWGDLVFSHDEIEIYDDYRE